MDKVSLFITKDLDKKKIEAFETLIDSYGKRKNITNGGECGNTKCYTLEVTRKDAPIIISLLKEIDCYVRYETKSTK